MGRESAPEKQGPWSNLSPHWGQEAQALNRGPGRVHTVFCRSSSILGLGPVSVNQQRLLEPMETETWAWVGEGAQEISLLPGSPCAEKELDAHGSFYPVQRNQSENRFLCFYCPENSQIKNLELPTHILTAKNQR